MVVWVIGSAAVGWFVADILVAEHGSVVYFLVIIVGGFALGLVHAGGWMINQIKINRTKEQA